MSNLDAGDQDELDFTLDDDEEDSDEFEEDEDSGWGVLSPPAMSLVGSAADDFEDDDFDLDDE